MFNLLLQRSFFVFLVSCWLLTGCVSRGKYLSTLQQKSSAESELTITLLDFEDAKTSLKRQALLIDELRAEIKRLDSSVTDLSSQSKNDQVQLGASLNKAQKLLESNQTLLAIAEEQLGLFKGYYSAREARIQEVMRLLSSALTGLPTAQVSTEHSEGMINLKFGEGLFFTRNGSKLSDFGHSLMQKLALSLSDQSDLLVDVVAYPTVSAGTINAWNSASERANVIGHEFVARYGLSPKQVSATGKQGELIIIDGAPAESKQRKTVELVIRLNPSTYRMPLIEY